MTDNHGVEWYGEQLKAWIGLSSSPVGVRFLADREQFADARALKQHHLAYVHATGRSLSGEGGGGAAVSGELTMGEIE